MEDAMKYLITTLKSHVDSKERDRTGANSLSVGLEMRANTNPLLC